jgi:hypothetical protein
MIDSTTTGHALPNKHLHKAKPKPKSEVAFPYFDLEKSIEVARVMHARAGGRCDRMQLASFLGYSGIKNGGFLTRVSAAKMFGLIEELNDSIVLSERAKKIIFPVRPIDASQAKLDAFLSVELFRRVFDEFEGQVLPTEAGLTHLFANNYKIVPLQIKSAIRNLMESAESAGIFLVAGNRSKMMRPILNESAFLLSSSHIATQETQLKVDKNNEVDRSSDIYVANGSESLSNAIHPALLGLLKDLPKIGEKLGPKRRISLIEAFKSSINFIYPEEED